MRNPWVALDVSTDLLDECGLEEPRMRSPQAAAELVAIARQLSREER